MTFPWDYKYRRPPPPPAAHVPASIGLMSAEWAETQQYGTYGATFPAPDPAPQPPPQPTGFPTPNWEEELQGREGEPPETTVPLPGSPLPEAMPYDPPPLLPADRSFVPLVPVCPARPDWRGEEEAARRRDAETANRAVDTPAVERPVVPPPRWREADSAPRAPMPAIHPGLSTPAPIRFPRPDWALEQRERLAAADPELALLEELPREHPPIERRPAS